MPLIQVHEYLVAFLHSEGMGREFIDCEGKATTANDIVAIDKMVAAKTGLTDVKVFSIQQLGVKTWLKR